LLERRQARHTVQHSHRAVIPLRLGAERNRQQLVLLGNLTFQFQERRLFLTFKTLTLETAVQKLAQLPPRFDESLDSLNVPFQIAVAHRSLISFSRAGGSL